jgi:hypothetical protein
MLMSLKKRKKGNLEMANQPKTAKLVKLLWLGLETGNIGRKKSWMWRWTLQMLQSTGQPRIKHPMCTPTAQPATPLVVDVHST